MRRCGIGDELSVVAYDDAGGSIAARLWWMLRATGHSAAVFDGGISTWTGELSIDMPSRRSAARFTMSPWPMGMVADAIAVDTFRRSADCVVLDARAPERYRGEPNAVDLRPGHIPGAVNAPWAGNINPATGRFHSPTELRARFDALGADDTRNVVCHCGSGVTACHNLLALEIAGRADTRLYPGSWSDWSADPDRPIATGELPGGEWNSVTAVRADGKPTPP